MSKYQEERVDLEVYRLKIRKTNPADESKGRGKRGPKENKRVIWGVERRHREK